MALSLDEALGMSLADETDESIHVDVNTRQITIPESQKLFGVESDADVEVKHIVIDGRYADGNRDLSELAWRVIYRNANKDTSYYLIPSVVANENSIEMDWLIKRSVVAYKGTVDFILCAFATTSSGEVTPEWNSTLGQGIVLEGLETSAIDINKEVVDELAKILYETIKSRDAAASSATDAAKSQSAAAASERNAEASKKLAATSESNASASASAAAASETAAKASANKAQALVEGIPDDYATALKDISRLKENKLDKPNNPVVGQLLRVKSISDTGEITLETVADNDDNKLPTGGSTGQVLAKSTNSDYDVDWVDQAGGSDVVIAVYQKDSTGASVLDKTFDELLAAINANKVVLIADKTSSDTVNPSYFMYEYTSITYGLMFIAARTHCGFKYDYGTHFVSIPFLGLKSDGTITSNECSGGILPSGGYPGEYLRKTSTSGYDAEWVTCPFQSEKVWGNKNLSSGTFSPQSFLVTGNTSKKWNSIVSDYTLCYTDAEEISASYNKRRMYTLTIPSDKNLDGFVFRMQTARGYRDVLLDEDGFYGFQFKAGFNTQTNTEDNSVAIPYAVYAVLHSFNREDGL